MKPLYLCYFTSGNGYEAEAAQLAKTLNQFALPFEMTAVPPLANWQSATQHKARYMLEMQRRHLGPVVWLDADARVRQYPSLFDSLDCDFAAHWKDGEEMLAGTLYFAGNAASIELCGAWVAENAANPNARFGDQLNLQRVVERMDGLRVTRLPAPYALIFDTMAEQGPPVIEHMQASRRLRT